MPKPRCQERITTSADHIRPLDQKGPLYVWIVLQGTMSWENVLKFLSSYWYITVLCMVYHLLKDSEKGVEANSWWTESLKLP